MIKLAGQKPLIRETTAPFETTADDGTLVTEDIRVRYLSHSIARLRDNAVRIQKLIDEARDKGEPLWLSSTLPFQIESLPDIAGLDGKPIVVAFDKDGNPTAKTFKNFEAIARHNLEAIQKAITDDLAPKEQPSK